MKIVTLSENTTCRKDLLCEHGLSLYIETGDLKILFDMGQTDAFAQNAKTLGIDLSQVDIAVLSHGHYDHGGGLQAFLQINPTAPVYVHQNGFSQYYNGTEKYIGLSPELQSNPRLIFTSGHREIAPGMTLYDCNDFGWRFDSCGLNKKEADIFMEDDFTHEQYLQIREGEKIFVFSGCSHKGIMNITRYFDADILVGGFHLNKVEDIPKLTKIAEELLRSGSVFYTGHCTGQKQFACLKDRMGDRLHSLSSGTILEI